MSHEKLTIYDSRASLKTNSGDKIFYSLNALESAGIGRVSRLPYSIKILLESVLRNHDDFAYTEAHVNELANWSPGGKRTEIPFLPARIILQDFTGVPALVDIAAMRSALARLGGDPERIQPELPVDLVIDHSVQVDSYGLADALARNNKREFERNRERYEFLKWGQQSIDGLRVAPPSTGIVHQVNLEYLGRVVFEAQKNGESLVYPDSLVGTDSHTPMINGLGVLGWGVGGIEAEATMLGQPMSMLVPDVIGFKLSGSLPEGTTATDLVLVITEILRKEGVVGKFVEFFGQGLSNMTLPDRATIANMSPEQGATVGYFPIDDETLRYMRLSGRDEDLIDLTERYAKEQGLFRTDETPDPQFSKTLELNMGTVVPSLAGPRRPQDRLDLGALADSFRSGITRPVSEGGFAVSESERGATAEVHWKPDPDGPEKPECEEISHGSVVIASITSCTNTSNPSVMIAAGLLAKNAVKRGLTVPGYVKTSLAPGSQVVTEYLTHSGLLPYLEKLGFFVVAYGCTSCIGNSGPLSEPVVNAIDEKELVVASVLSGNRNFEGRVSPHTRANYLASPPLVVAYALAGNVNVNLTTDPLGRDNHGDEVYLRDIWPSAVEICRAVNSHVSREMFIERYASIWDGAEEWKSISSEKSGLYEWNDDSTYIHEPPFFKTLTKEVQPIGPIKGMRALALFGDSITTDHISPAGAIPADGPAGVYLQSLGINPKEFNSFGSRRGNDRVMIRGTFGNIRIKNRMTPGVEGGVTVHQPSGEQMSIYDAAMKYADEHVPLIVIAGKEYGSGSSRDWAAKGTYLQGVRAVLAETFERIHRSNLVGMGVLPLEFTDRASIESLKLDGSEKYSLIDLDDNLQPRDILTVRVLRADGSSFEIKARARIDTPVEVGYYRNGGILHSALRAMA